MQLKIKNRQILSLSDYGVRLYNSLPKDELGRTCKLHGVILEELLWEFGLLQAYSQNWDTAKPADADDILYWMGFIHSDQKPASRQMLAAYQDLIPY